MEREVSSPRSLARVIGVFEAVARESEGMSLAELSAVLSSPKSSLLTLLRPLVSRGHLTHVDGRYRIGPALFRLASDILAQRRFPQLVRPMMEELVARCGESVYLALIDRDARTVIYVDGVESPAPVRYAVPVGTSRPLYTTAAGKALLAFQDEAWRERYLASESLRPRTENTITDAETLRKTLAEIRRTGLSVSRAQENVYSSGLAAPIFRADGTVAAALLIGIPANRFDELAPELGPLVVEAAARVSSIMGWEGGGQD